MAGDTGKTNIVNKGTRLARPANFNGVNKGKGTTSLDGRKNRNVMVGAAYFEFGAFDIRCVES